jgi:glycosyltransferase involved in cell wall biosynthesis
MQTLTVLMPVARIDCFLLEAINSLKKQSFNDFKCLILTVELEELEIINLQNIISNDIRFSVHVLGLNGICFALNYGIHISKSKYIARMDADDISYPFRFEKQIKFLEENQDYVAVGCRIDLIDQDGKPLKKSFKFYESNIEIRRALKYRMPLCHPAMIFRSSVLQSNNGYMYGNTAEDHELYLRLARDRKNLFKNLPDRLFAYRKHDYQLTNIKYARKAFCNMAGFFFTEFLWSGNPIYLIGIIANLPILRSLRNIYTNSVRIK